MTEADSYDEADEGEETTVVIQYRRSTKVAGKGSCIRLGVSGVCATASAFLIGGHFDSLFISHSFFNHSFPSFAMAGILKIILCQIEHKWLIRESTICHLCMSGE